MSDLEKRKWWFIGIAVFAFCMWNPITRQIVLIILPFGSGLDDLVFLAATAGAFIAWLLYKAQKRKDG